jgi:hypothetical protein
MNEPSEDFERRLADRVRTYIEDGIGSADPVEPLMRPRATPRRVGLARMANGTIATGALALGVIGLIAALALRPGSPTGTSGATTPGSSLVPSTGGTSPTFTTIPTSVHTRFIPSAWVLRTLPTPSSHPAFVVRAVSPDGATVIFQDPSVYDELYIERAGSVESIVLPGHEVGTPMFVGMSPGGAIAIVLEANRLWRYDVASGAISPIPDFPASAGTTGILGLAFVSEHSLAVLAATGDQFSPSSQLWTLDLEKDVYAPLGDRHNALAPLVCDSGVVLIVDESARHDNTGWHLYLVDPEGTDRLLFDATGVGYLAVAPDCKRLVISKGEAGRDGTYVVDLQTGASRRIAPDGIVRSFAPDGQLFAITFGDAHIEAFTLDGVSVNSLPSADPAAWVGVP